MRKDTASKQIKTDMLPGEMKLYFVPKPDITTYELAYIMSRCGGYYGLTGGIVFSADQWLTVPEQIKRHFQDTQDKTWKGPDA